MKLIVGLGNSGEKYQDTRHNVGFMVLDKLANDLGFTNYDLRKNLKSYIVIHKSCIFAKPQTFMNSSGEAVKKLIDFYKIKPDDLWVVHDDLDIRLGIYKIQKGVGPKVHYGVNSIEERLGSEDFWRVRIGVDNRDPENRTSGEDYVLQNFREEEIPIINKVIDEVAREISENVSLMY